MKSGASSRSRPAARGGVLAALLVVALALGVWTWRRQTGNASETKPATTAIGSGAMGTPRTGMPSLSPTDPATSGSVAAGSETGSSGERLAEPPVDAPYINPPAVQARMTEAHAHLQDVAKPCLALATPRPKASDEFRFSYTLTIRDKQATVSDLQLVWSDLKGAKVEDCLLEKLVTARWSTTEGDMSTTVEDALSGGELE